MELLSDFKREVSRRYGTLLEDKFFYQPVLHSHRSERHRTLDLRRGHAQDPAGEQRAARADSRPVVMRGSQLALLAVLLAASACRIEDRTPAGTRRDEDAVQALVAAYARTLSDRDWVGTRRLFWRDGSYSGPLIPRSVGQTLSDRFRAGR